MEMAGFVQFERTNILTLFKVAERTLLLFSPLPLAAKRYRKAYSVRAKYLQHYTCNCFYLYLWEKIEVMNTKLTLTIEQDVIQKAKDYAKKKNRSLSDIIENYLKSLTREDNPANKTRLSPIVQSLKGSFKMPSNFDYKEELTKGLEEKYL